MSQESMALKVIKKINQKLKFLYRKNRFFTRELRRLLCNAIIQPHFDYACSSWYPNLTRKLKKKLQVMQSQCIRVCLQLDKMSTISHKEFKDLNWLSVITRFEQCVISIVFKFINGSCSYYLNEVFEFAPEGNASLRNDLFEMQTLVKSLIFNWSFVSESNPRDIKVNR